MKTYNAYTGADPYNSYLAVLIQIHLEHKGLITHDTETTRTRKAQGESTTVRTLERLPIPSRAAHHRALKV